MNNEISANTLLSVTASIAAAIIPDTPIVSIAGSTISEITTTTTSTTTTPTPTSFESLSRNNKDHIVAILRNNPMSDAAVAKTAGGNGTTTANAAATNVITTSNTVAEGGAVTGRNVIIEHATAVNVGKPDDATTPTTVTTETKKSDVSDLEEPDLKRLLEEAYTYKTPKDKKDKSEIFLDLLQKVENEDLGITSTRSDSHRHHPHSQSRHQQKQGGSLQDLVQLPSDYRRQNHTSRHKKNSSVSSRQREGGSLPSNVNVANCLLSSFEQHSAQTSSVYTDKRQLRRAFLLGVETATAALNSTNTLIGVVSGTGGGSNVGTISNPSCNKNSNNLCSKETGSSFGTGVTTASSGGSNMATTAGGHTLSGTMANGAGVINVPAVNNDSSIGSGGDYIINIGDMIDIQQQQQILPSKAQDVGGQGLPFYERVDIDMRIPRPNLHRGDGADFAPARSHHYVDEVIRFHQIDSGVTDNSGPGISVNTVSNTLKSATASCSLPMPLDERYRSIKSVMGEKGDSAGAGVTATIAKTAATTATNGNISSSNVNITNNSTSGSGSSSIGIGSYTKSLPLSRQTDENGNDCERQQHSSSSSIIVSAGQSQAKAKTKKKPQKDNTKTVEVEKEAGYRGNEPIEVLVKFIENTEEDSNKQSGSGSSNKFAENSKRKERKKEKEKQNKMKKSNSLEELRSCAKIDVGELKRSAATTESNNVTMRNKGSGGGKGAKTNSASTADINKNFDSGGKEIAVAPAHSSGKQMGVLGVTGITNTTAANNRKCERRSWGTEELQYLGTEVVGSNNNVTFSGEEKVKEKKERKSKDKDKEKEKEKDKERDVDKDKGRDREKDKEKDCDKYDKLTNNVDGSVKSDKHEKLEKTERHEKTERLEKHDKPEKHERPEKIDKLEKRKKSDNVLQSSPTPTKTSSSAAQERQNLRLIPIVNAPILSDIDILSMNSLLSETAEFHVVTKKKRPKKQRASIDETHFAQNSNTGNVNNYNYNNNNSSNISGTTSGFSRAHNLMFNSQKNGSSNNNSASTFGGQQQQQTRYKYYNNAHGFSAGNNSNVGGGVEYHNYSNYNNNNNSNSNQQYGQQQQQQQQQHQSQYHHHHHQHQQQQHQQMNANNISGGSVDKSRRKSTSSVPPSEKSDSSDLDSVHSLPIESTTVSAVKSKQRHKSISSAETTPETPKSAGSGGSPASAPISYAHIAAAAAVDRWPSLDPANSNSLSTTSVGGQGVASGVAEQQQHTTNAEGSLTILPSGNNTTNMNSTAILSTTNPPTKLGKSKKLVSKPDFPELVATNATVGDIGKTPSSSGVASAFKSISYSQSLVATPAQLNIVTTCGGGVSEAPTAAVTTVSPAAVSTCNSNVTDFSKVDVNPNISTITRLPNHQPSQHHQQQQQTLQKSKSVEHDSYSYSSNLDQQYPALEKTVKRHSTTNVSMGAAVISASNATGSFSSGGNGVCTALSNTSVTSTSVANIAKFNFAAAAKQQANISSLSGNKASVTTVLSTMHPPISAPSGIQVAVVSSAPLPLQISGATTSNTNYAMTTSATVATSNSVIAAVVPITATNSRKSKEKSPMAIFATTTSNDGQIIQHPTIASSLMVNASDTGVSNTVRKSKKEKQHQNLSSEASSGLSAPGEQRVNVAQKSSTATQTHSTPIEVIGGKLGTISLTSSAAIDSEIGLVSQAFGKTQRQHINIASCSHKIGPAVAPTVSSNANASTTAAVGGVVANRPAVIILNDDRSSDCSAVGIEFTFGDFNEDELKLFDESITEDECVDEFVDCHADEPTYKQQSSAGAKMTMTTSGGAPTNTGYFNDSGVASDISNTNNVTPYADNTARFAGANTSSPNSSFVGQNNVIRAPVTIATGMNDDGTIIKVDSGSSSDKLSTQTSSDDSTENVSVPVVSAIPATEQQQNSVALQLQQLETCNDIETAIIAAARAAAEQQQQPMQPPQQQRSYRHKHQQQQYRNTTYGNVYDSSQQREHRSQSYLRDTPNHYHQQQQQQHHYHNQYHHQQQHHHYHHQSGSSNSVSRSRSSSGTNNTNSFDASASTPPPQSPNLTPSVVVNIQRKEFDIHFIPPTLSSAFSALQHNDVIVDFIGSAWEEVAKVTKFYEGH